MILCTNILLLERDLYLVVLLFLSWPGHPGRVYACHMLFSSFFLLKLPRTPILSNSEKKSSEWALDGRATI